ncbi:MAG: DUF370 domain-containing protein [Clostridia bacterium]|nr:DUF370 domain-containing protein [Clostridia bacterium]MBR4799138.1 DUF370 domain-containing protein [Clostridia bacterium]MBR5746080.1 DUF370 domain-containing protein [Clostridia bacterium]
MGFIDAGFGNFVNAARIITVVSPESLPVRRLIQDAKNAGRVIDVSCGKKTKSVIVTDSDHVICSALEPNEISALIR